MVPEPFTTLFILFNSSLFLWHWLPHDELRQESHYWKFSYYNDNEIGRVWDKLLDTWDTLLSFVSVECLASWHRNRNSKRSLGTSITILKIYWTSYLKPETHSNVCGISNESWQESRFITMPSSHGNFVNILRNKSRLHESYSQHLQILRVLLLSIVVMQIRAAIEVTIHTFIRIHSYVHIAI